MEFNFAITTAIIFADSLSDEEERNMTAITKNHLENFLV